MADTYSTLFQTYRTLYEQTSNGFHPVDVQQAIAQALDAFGKLVSQADATAPQSKGATGLVLQLETAANSLASLMANARQRDATKIVNAAALDQSNYRKLAERQQAADAQLSASLTLLVQTIAEGLGAPTAAVSPTAVADEAEALDRQLSAWSQPTSQEAAAEAETLSGVDSPEDEP